MKLVRNWLKTLIRSATGDEIRAQRAAEAEHVAKLTREMANSLEMLNSYIAREASRRARETQRALKEREAESAPAPAVGDIKSVLRARLVSGGRAAIIGGAAEAAEQRALNINGG